MKKHTKVLMAIIALLSCFTVFAASCSFGGTQSGNSGSSGNAPEFEDGDGTESDPYIISKPYQWTNINKHLSAYYELGADLNMGDQKNLTPVGSDTAPFTGYLDGKSHKVHSATLKTALFGTISEGTVKNLNFADSTINSAVASFADTVKMGATVENCHMTSITMLSNVSAVAGMIKTVSSASNVKYCSVNLTWTCDYGNESLGGLIYQVLGGNIDCCWATGTIKITKKYFNAGADFGSLACKLSNGSITNCYTQYSTNSPNYEYVSHMVFDRTGGKMDFCLNINDYTDALAKEWKMFHSSSVEEESTLKFYGTSTLDSSNDLLDTDEWKNNKLWKKGKLHPELVSYEEYLQITAESN